MPNRFMLAKRLPEKDVFLCNQFGVRDLLTKKWTPVFVLPLVAAQCRDWLNSGEKTVEDFDWTEDDGLWDPTYHWEGTGKFGFLSSESHI